MKHYVSMKLVIILCQNTDIITTSGINEKITNVSGFWSTEG